MDVGGYWDDLCHGMRKTWSEVLLSSPCRCSNHGTPICKQNELVLCLRWCSAYNVRSTHFILHHLRWEYHHTLCHGRNITLSHGIQKVNLCHWTSREHASHCHDIEYKKAVGTFCTGFTVHFIVVAIFFLWFIHLAYVAILFKFPFFGKTLVKKARLVHAVSVPTALLLCLIGPTVTLLWCGYFTARFPNWICLPSNMDVLFYTISLPLNIFLGVGATITLSTIWEIHKVCNARINAWYNVWHGVML